VSELNALPPPAGKLAPRFTDDDLVIHRGVADAGPPQLIFRCKRYAPELTLATVRMPLCFDNGTLPGKLACVGTYGHDSTEASAATAAATVKLWKTSAECASSWVVAG
jgi:hypothetical protein